MEQITITWEVSGIYNYCHETIYANEYRQFIIDLLAKDHRFVASQLVGAEDANY